jgi:hypothetical protein
MYNRSSRRGGEDNKLSEVIMAEKYPKLDRRH